MMLRRLLKSPHAGTPAVLAERKLLAGEAEA